MTEHQAPNQAPITFPKRSLPARETSLLSELLCGFDWLALRASSVYRGEGVTRGEGQPVVLVPGFLADDTSLLELHGWLGRMGYRPYMSGIGRHAACGTVLLPRLLATVRRAHAAGGGRPVTIIGHSLGGVLARRAAQAEPGLIGTVVTLGSPVNGLHVHPLMAAIADALRGSCAGECVAEAQQRLPGHIRQFCVYTTSDGVVDWRDCLRGDADANIRVTGTHSGLVCNAEVCEAIAALLRPAAKTIVHVPAARPLDPRQPRPIRIVGGRHLAACQRSVSATVAQARARPS